jgi:hypothetical protein
MSLPFLPSDAAMLLLQAGCVAAPRLAPGTERLRRLRGRGWAIVPVGSIVGVIFMIRYASSTATWITYLALVAVPLLAAAALGWSARGARPILALIVIPLFIGVWQLPNTLLGEACGCLLSALSCVTLGVLLAAVAPSGWLKVGIIAMSAADVWLVASNLLQAPNQTLDYAHPAAGLPSLQSETFGSVSMGYGDLFVAGVLGALLARQAARQRVAALLTLALASCFDVLFLVLYELPATVPVALALIIMEAWAWRSRRRRQAGRPGDLAPGADVAPAVAVISPAGRGMAPAAPAPPAHRPPAEPNPALSERRRSQKPGVATPRRAT